MTPGGLLLTRLLKTRGYSVSIMTRGYGRRSTAVERVNPDGDAGWYGDEPMLLARRSGAPVFVGQNRYEAGVLAEREAGAAAVGVGVHVLDDGFQHWGLGRDVDVVLLTREDLEDALLPAGNLRESLRAVREADVVVLREEELPWTDKFMAKIRRGARAPLIWVVRRSLLLDGKEDAPKRPLVFCGIARPDGFVAMLRKQGVEAGETVFFADHYDYRELDAERLVELAIASGADGFLTTEKDAVKFTPAMQARLKAVGPMVVARLEVELLNENVAMDKLIRRVRAMDRRRRRKVAL